MVDPFIDRILPKSVSVELIKFLSFFSGQGKFHSKFHLIWFEASILNILNNQTAVSQDLFYQPFEGLVVPKTMILYIFRYFHNIL